MFLLIETEYEDSLKVTQYQYIDIVYIPEREYRLFVEDNKRLGITSDTTIEYFYDAVEDVINWAKQAKTGDYLNRGSKVWVCTGEE